MAQAYYNTSSTGASFSPLTADMVGAAASNHSHGLLNSTLGIQIANTATDSGWSMINDNYSGFLLKALRTQANSPSWIENNYAAGICAGGGDTKMVLSTGYSNGRMTVAGGNGTKPQWWWSIQGTNGNRYNLNNFVSPSNPEVVVSSSQPTNSNARIWIKV